MDGWGGSGDHSGHSQVLRDGVHLAKYTEVSAMYTGAGSVELRVYVCVHMHACDCGYTGTGVYICWHVCTCANLCFPPSPTAGAI